MAGEFYLSNLVGNFDYKEILDKFKVYKSQEIFLLQEKEQKIAQKKSAYKEFANLLDSFKDIVENVLKPTLFSEKSVKVSNENAVSVTVTDPTKVPPTNIDFEVLQLAQNSVWGTSGTSSNTVKDKDAVLSDLDSGTLRIEYDDGKYLDIDYDNTDSLQSIVDKINNAAEDNNVKIQASAVFDGNEYRLIIKSLETGYKNRIRDVDDVNSGSVTLEDKLGSFKQFQAGKNAKIALYKETGSDTDYIVIKSSTNVFNEAIEGLSIEVKETTNKPVNLTIEKDFQPVKDTLENLVNKYNEIVDFIKDKTGEKGVLSGDYTLQSIRSQIMRTFSPLMELGLINVDKNTGHISIKQDELDEYLKNDIDTLKSKITETGENLKNYLYTVLDPEGPIKSREKGFDRQIQNIEKKIELDSKRINEEIEILKKQFIALQIYMAQMDDVKQRLTAMFFSGQQKQ